MRACHSAMPAKKNLPLGIFGHSGYSERRKGKACPCSRRLRYNAIGTADDNLQVSGAPCLVGHALASNLFLDATKASHYTIGARRMEEQDKALIISIKLLLFSCSSRMMLYAYPVFDFHPSFLLFRLSIDRPSRQNFHRLAFMTGFSSTVFHDRTLLTVFYDRISIDRLHDKTFIGRLSRQGRTIGTFKSGLLRCAHSS